MSDKKKADKVAEAEANPTVITLVLPVDKTKPATVTVRNGDLGHLSSFAYDDFKDICTAINDGMRAFIGVQAEPPKDIQSAKPVVKKTSKKASNKPTKAKGKAPYRLQDALGQTRTLNTMFDPFELQEKYHKANPKLKFDDLDEASEVAQILIDAGIEKTVTISYSNGQAVKVLPEKDVSAETIRSDGLPVADATDQTNEDDPIVTSDVAETDTNGSDDEHTTVVAEESAEVDKADDDTENEGVIDDSSDEIDVPDNSATEVIVVDASTTAKPAPVIQALTSPELAKEEGMPEYNEFSLATDDDDDDDADSNESSTPVAETAQATLF